MKKIFISTSSFAQYSEKPIHLLENNGFKIIINQNGRKLKKSECLKLYHDYDGIIAGTEIFDQDVLDYASKLKVISRVGVGIDNIDMAYAKKRCIDVHRSQTQPSLAVAELVLGIILDLIRKISIQNQEMKIGVWNKKMGSLLSGKTLGIIGLGSIGKTLIRITQGLSLKYLAYDMRIDKKFAKSYDVKYCDLDHLLKSSDFISIHLTLNQESIGLISTQEFKIMKNSVILVNTSRGEIIDEEALLDAISNNIIAGVGLDVYHIEPYIGPVTKFNNVILTPHIGSYAREIRVAMELEAAQNLIYSFKMNKHL